MKFYLKITRFVFIIGIFACASNAQNPERKFAYKTGETVEITNLHGRVFVRADESSKDKIMIEISSDKPLAASEITFDNSNGLKIEVMPQNTGARIDLTVKLPARARVRVTTGEGEVRVSGDLESAEAVTETGTIAADVPLDNLKYNFLWTASRPRFISDVTLEEVKEKSAGRFVLKGKIIDEDAETKANEAAEEETSEAETTAAEKTENSKDSKNKKKKPKIKKPKTSAVSLDFTTARGIILLNVNPNEVPSDLRERPLRRRR